MVRLAVMLALAVVGLADTVKLRDGRVVEGSLLDADARQVRVKVGEGIETFERSAVERVEFSEPVAEQAPAPVPTAAIAPASETAVISAPATPSTPEPARSVAAGTLNGVAALVAIIEAAPATPKAPETVAQPFLSVPGQGKKEPAEVKPAQSSLP